VIKAQSENLGTLLERFHLRGREDWKYSDLKLFSPGRFVPYESDGAEATSSEIPAGSGVRLVFINGVFSPENSHFAELPEGLSILPLAGSRSIPGQADNFLAELNTVCAKGGLIFEIDEEAVLEEPLHMHFLTDSGASGKLLSTRNLIRAGRGSKATIVEHFNESDGGEFLNVPVTEVFCGADSDIRHLKVVREGNAALHLGSTHVHQDGGSRYTSREFALGGRMVRRELHLKMTGENSSCDVTALSMAGGEDRRDMRTRIDHLAAKCETHELYKGLFDDQSRGVFDGKVLVAKDAQQTNAHQTNRNLLLGDDAISYSIPRLEIYADDVKCSHGSTTGQLDDDQVFFLRSRGFDSGTARVMLAKAFAGEILEGLQETELREELEVQITARLGRGLPGEIR
jgi:Fe-S cluster assembly protein SufD